MPETAEHWEHVYATKPTTEASWFQRQPEVSLRLIESLASGTESAIIDVGAGSSLLVDRLLARDFSDLTVLGISHHVIDEVRQRLGENAATVNTVCHDLLRWVPDRQFDIWHDRAVLHFLVEPSERDRYVKIAERAVREQGALVIGTFAEDGPTQCSGLPVARYSVEDLAELFSTSFMLATHEREQHVTPAGVVQPFAWVVLRRK